MGYYCNICKKGITRAEFFYSNKKFNRALCREHQELERRNKDRQADTMVEIEAGKTNTEENLDSDEKSTDGAPKTGRKSLGKKVAVKMGKGLIKGVKKIAGSSKKLVQIRKWKGAILRRMTMSQLKRLCFEKKVSTKKSVLKEDERSGEDYWKEVDCSKGDLVSRLRNKAPLDAIISFAKRNHINLMDIITDIERKKAEWRVKELTEKGEEKDLKPEHRWRIEVLTRDKNTCRVCRKVGGNSAHHIYSRKYCQEHDEPELEWDTRNGITVCYECHKKITIDGRKWFKENEKLR